MKKIFTILLSGLLFVGCNDASAIKNRQPIANMFVKADFTLDDFFKVIIEDELNVKKVEFTEDLSEYTSYTFKPQLRTVGPKYGKFLGGIQKALASLDGNAAYADLKANGAIKLPEVDASIELAEEDLLITVTQKEGYVTDGDNYVSVVLDTNLTPELIEEGFVREIISKIQTMRKEAGFEVMDHISVSYTGEAEVENIFEKFGQDIAGEVLAESVSKTTPDGFTKEWNINGKKVSLGVKKL